MTRSSTAATATAMVLALMAATPAASESAEAFYKDRQLSLIVSFNAGGGADAYARLVGRHLGRHLPGEPKVLVKNMPGAGGLLAANHLYNVAPRDGSVLGMFPGNIASLPLLKPAQVKFDVSLFKWIGSPATEVMLCVTSPTACVKSFEQLFGKEMVTGTAGTASHDVPATLNGILGTKLKLVGGYKGSSGLRLATERGEIEGFCGIGYDSLKPAIVAGRLTPIVQVAVQDSPELKGVPNIFRYAKTDEQRQLLRLMLIWGELARPIVAPPETPEPIFLALRKGFGATMKDPAFLEDAAKLSLSVEPVSGEQITTMIADVYRTPRDIIDKAAALLQKR